LPAQLENPLGELLLALLRLALVEPARLFLERLNPARQLLARRAEAGGELPEKRPILLRALVGERPGQRLDPPRPRGDRGFGLDPHVADLPGATHVASAAELPAIVLDDHLAHPLAVFLPEEGHRSLLLRFLERRDLGPDRKVG